MNTQNLEYSDEVKSHPIVADAFSKRDDVQQEIYGIDEEREHLLSLLKIQDEARVEAAKRLAIADDKLALVATMAQDCIDRIEEVRKECDESLTLALGSLNSLIEVSESVDGGLAVVSANNVERERDALAIILGIDLSADDNDQDSEEVQEELALTG